jgi:TRAP-type C4-dicarboxylate transport system permease small subunit
VKKIIKIYQKIEETFLIICFVIMGIVLTSQIISRYALNIPIAWAEELARYLQIWITFIGIGFGLRSNSHISLSLLREEMPKKVGFIIEFFINLLIIISSILIVIFSPKFLLQQDKMASTMQISLQIVYVAIPIGFGMTIIYKISETIELVKTYHKKKYGESL